MSVGFVSEAGDMVCCSMLWVIVESILEKIRLICCK